MNYEKWLSENTESLKGKRVAITGSTGGLGKEICRYLVKLGASLVLVDRSRERSERNRDELIASFPGVSVELVTADLSDMSSVRRATAELSLMDIDVFLHNAGAYSIPRCETGSGYENVYTINFISPYYMIRELLPSLRAREGRVVVVGSIAHNYSKIDADDVDFATRKQASKVYGNAKRYLMFSLYELFKSEDKVKLAVTHPGITFTNITSHYPKLIFALIKHPMKVIFMKPAKAALCIVRGFFETTEYHMWIGPRVFNVWGLPKKMKLRTCSTGESESICFIADRIYTNLKADSTGTQQEESKI